MPLRSTRSAQFLESRQERERRQAASGGPNRRDSSSPRVRSRVLRHRHRARPQDIDWAMNEEEILGDQ